MTDVSRRNRKQMLPLKEENQSSLASWYGTKYIRSYKITIQGNLEGQGNSERRRTSLLRDRYGKNKLFHFGLQLKEYTNLVSCNYRWPPLEQATK